MWVKRPANEKVDEAITRQWADEIRASASSGDWIMARSYTLLGDMITLATGGDEYSHSAIYDAERGTVIEAISPVVREVPLDVFVHRYHHLVVVRPAELGEKDLHESLLRARAQIGVPYDHLGLLGLDDPQRFYCSEFLPWAIRAEERGIEVPKVVGPSHLTGYGEVVYYSGAREDMVARGLVNDAPRFAARSR